jgi:hypothetical protein
MRRIPRRAFCCFVLVTIAWGCGSETYQQRFEESKKFYAYRERLNQLLSPKWSAAGVSWCPPKQFQLIPPRPKPRRKKQENEETERDPRQPTFAEIELPGLLGAWQADLHLSGGQGSAKGFLYLASNLELLRKKVPDEKAKFFNDHIIRTIATALQEKVPPLDKLGVFEVPKGEAFVERRKFRVFRPGFKATVDDKEYRIAIFAYMPEQSQIQISIVLAIPADVSPSEKIDAAIDLSLETLEADKQLPAGAAAPGPKPAAGPRNL